MYIEIPLSTLMDKGLFMDKRKLVVPPKTDLFKKKISCFVKYVRSFQKYVFFMEIRN